MSKSVDLANVLLRTLESTAECDSNFENPNVVDGLYVLARAIHHLARAIGKEPDPNVIVDDGVEQSTTT